MSKVESLEREIEKLTSEELAAFREWFATYDADAWDRQIERDVSAGNDADAWDRQIERDVSAGKLNRLAAEALAAHDRGQTKGM